jgi:hypothetical protein
MPSHPPVDFVAELTNRNLLSFEAQSKNLSRWFWESNHQTVAIGFEAKTGKSSTTLVLRVNQEIVATGFEVKLEKTVPIVLRPNHWQTVNLGFEAQTRNSRSSSPRVR